MPKRGRWEEHPELLKQRSQEGVVKATTLESLEITSKTIYRNCLPGGPWQRVLPGIILLHNGKPTRREMVIAALLYAGPDAMVTGAEACRRYGLQVPEQYPETDVHVLVPQRHKVLSSEFVTVERTWRLPGAWVREGIRLAPTVRATTDAVRRLRTEEPIGRLFVEAVQRGRCSPRELAREIDEGTKRGTAVPRRLLAEWLDLRSVAELWAKELAQRLAVPPTHWNPELRDAAGNYVGCPDGWWEDVGLAWEIDSFDFHFYRDGYRRTLARNNRYSAAGIVVVQTLPSQLKEDPEGVLRELEAAYRTAAALPRPAVFLGKAA